MAPSPAWSSRGCITPSHGDLTSSIRPSRVLAFGRRLEAERRYRPALGRFKSRLRPVARRRRCNSILAWWRPEIFRASALCKPRNVPTARWKSNRAATHLNRRLPTSCALGPADTAAKSARDVRRRARQIRDAVRRVRARRARGGRRRFRRRLALAAFRIASLSAERCIVCRQRCGVLSGAGHLAGRRDVAGLLPSPDAASFGPT